MAAQVAGVFEENLREKILESKILVVGAGGIGCEILKNLVLCGFPNIEIIDLDTIDVSNLNRQFLFHKEHIGKSKAEVAKQSALNFNPNVNIKAYHDSILTRNYGIDFFQKFTLVLNALDNRQARNHVNRMCLAADIPLIESGTAGYDGQVELIKKGLTQCYECTPKPKGKTFPSCTIRNTPSEPIHCIVWAKHLFNQLFGEVTDDEEVSPDAADPENVAESGAEALTSQTNEAGNIQRVNTRQWAQDIKYDAEKLFNKFFHDDIKYLLSMDKLWKTRQKPEPINWQEALTATENDIQKESVGSVLPDQRLWNLEECARVFENSIQGLRAALIKLPENDHLVWDKDEKDAMDFVAACANIRSKIFHIPIKSRFDIKSMAGNIIPAIATTNAITAGISVMRAFKVLQGKYEECKSIYMRLRPNPRNQLFVPDKVLIPRNPKCIVCSENNQVTLKIDINKMTVKEFNDEVLIKTFNVIAPDVTDSVKGNILISSEEGETDDNNDKLLNELISHGTRLHVDDYLQQYELYVIILHKDAKRDEPLFEVCNAHWIEQGKPSENGDVSEKQHDNDKEQTESAPKRRKIDNNETSNTPAKSDKNDEDEDLCIIEEDSNGEATSTINEASSISGVKRKSDPGEGPSTSKKTKVANESDDDLMIVEEDDDDE